MDYVDSNTTLQLRQYQLRVSQVMTMSLYDYYVIILHLVMSKSFSTSCLVSSHGYQLFCILIYGPRDATSDAVMTANIRNIYSLLGLKCLPVLVHMSDNK